MAPSKSGARLRVTRSSRCALRCFGVGALISALGLVLLASAPHAAHAQGSAEDQRAAREAYDHATAAYLRHDYGQAASLFETAHRLAPAAAALVQAVRANERAGNALRAANLGLRLEALYPDDRDARQAAQRALQTAGRWVRVEVTCDGCRVQLDGGLMSHSTFFVEPGADHEIVGAFDTGEVRETISGAAGTTRALSFTAPERVVEPEPDPVDPTDPDPLTSTAPTEGGVDETPVASGGGGVPIWVSVTALVITAGLAGVLIWSGVDTLDGVPAYEMNPTMEALLDGQGREERTNWLIGGTAVAGAATLVLMILTDWSDGADSATAGSPPADPLRLSLDLGPDRAAVGVTGSF